MSVLNIFTDFKKWEVIFRVKFYLLLVKHCCLQESTFCSLFMCRMAVFMLVMYLNVNLQKVFHCSFYEYLTYCSTKKIVFGLFCCLQISKNKSKSFDFYTSDYIFVEIQSNLTYMFWVRKYHLRNWLLTVYGVLVCTQLCVTLMLTSVLRLFSIHAIPFPGTILIEAMWLTYLADWHSRWCTLGWNSCHTNDFTITSQPN